MQITTDNQWNIIRLGGSILVPDFADGELLKEFKNIILKQVQEGKKFLIIVGGGHVARKYQEALVVSGITEAEPSHWIGIYTIRLNAQLLRLAFEDYAHPQVFNKPEDLPAEILESVVIGAAEDPGHSSNYDAAVFAQKVGAQKIINLSNIDYVYNRDPRLNPDAVQYPEVGWKEYMTFIPQEHEPGGNSPFDIVASRYAHEHDMEVIFMKGNPINNLKKYLETGEVEGSVISNRFE